VNGPRGRGSRHCCNGRAHPVLDGDELLGADTRGHEGLVLGKLMPAEDQVEACRVCSHSFRIPSRQESLDIRNASRRRNVKAHELSRGGLEVDEHLRPHHCLRPDHLGT